MEDAGAGSRPLRFEVGHGDLLVMGGAMDVWETDAYPWLRDEVDAVREVMALRPCRDPGELGRLLGCSTAQIQEDRVAAARGAGCRERNDRPIVLVVVIEGVGLRTRTNNRNDGRRNF